MRTNIFLKAALCFLSCGAMAFAAAPVAPIQQQLQLAQENLASHQIPLKLTSFAPRNTLLVDQDVSDFQTQLVEDQNLVPAFDGIHPSSFALTTIAQHKTEAFGSASPEVLTEIQKTAFPLVKKGQQVMTLTWEANRREFQSQCLYDGNGIVYDNVLSNLVLLEDRNATEPIEAGANYVAAASYTRSAHPVNIDIRWIWGSRRGHIDVYHYAQISNGSVVSQWGNTSGWMTLGTANGEYHDLAKTKRYAKAAWAYGWATPTCSVRITWNPSKGKFDISVSGIGSKGFSQGTNVIYP